MYCILLKDLTLFQSNILKDYVLTVHNGVLCLVNMVKHDISLQPLMLLEVFVICLLYYSLRYCLVWSLVYQSNKD